MRLSIIIEWANTTFNGTSRAWQLLKILGEQWQSLISQEYPENLATEAKRFLANLDPHPEILLVSGEFLSQELIGKIKNNVPSCFELRIEIHEGLDYYSLKNLGGKLANGDLIMFLDSDVLPEEYWLAHLLSSFSNPDIKVCMGQTYIAPKTLIDKAFSLWWIFGIRDEQGKLSKPKKVFTNNLTFRSNVFHQVGFPSLGMRSRGAGSILKETLESMNISIWENSKAKVIHPAPENWKYLMIRALANGKDHYLKSTEQRSLRGITTNFKVGLLRLNRAFYRSFHYSKYIGLKSRELPVVLAIAVIYYGLFILSGILTFINPERMATKFRY